MTKFVNSFMFGLVLVLMIDFLVFVGLKVHYFDFYDIKEYFNTYFIDNQPWLILLIVSPILGYLILYAKFIKSVQIVYMLALVSSTLFLFEPFGQALGEELFVQKNQTYRIGSNEFKAELLYSSREFIYIKRDGIEHTIRIRKSDLSE